MNMLDYYQAAILLIRDLPLESQLRHIETTKMLITVDRDLKNITEEERETLFLLLDRII